MNQSFVKFSLPHETYIHANELREAVAKGLDGQEFDGKSAIFNYADANSTAMKRPDNCFLWGKGWVAYKSNDALTPAKIIAPAIQFFIQQNINVQTYVGEKTKNAFLTDEPRLYRVTQLADQRSKQRELKGIVRSPEENLTYMVQKMLKEAFNQGTIRQPLDPEDIHLRVIDAVQSGEVVSFKKQGKKAITKISSAFSINVDLQGIWQAGHLQSRGYGLIYPINRKGLTQCPV